MIEEKKIKFKGESDMPYIAVSLGTMRVNKTANWRAVKPILDEEKCIYCQICWKFCPEASIEPTSPPKIILDYCKGCGICIVECPVNAISSVKEGK